MSSAESLSYFPEATEEDERPRRHLSLVARAAAAVDVPVIVSLNCVTSGGWTEARWSRSSSSTATATARTAGYF